MNKIYFLALNRIPFIGPRTVFKLLNYWPNLEELFKLSEDEMLKAGLPSKIASSIAKFDLNQIDEDLQWEQYPGHHLLTWDDSNYPYLLKEINDPPVVIYAAGNLDCLKFPTLAMVGTRNPSPIGQETAWQFAYELALSNITIVSGLARGIDAKAHHGCLAAGGKTIAVMGTGINRIYPFQHRELAEEIKQNGLLVTEFFLNSSASAGHFPKRNRIISGLSFCTLVVEAAIKSGSLITARLALEQNRDVLAIPGSIHNPQARGCHHLLQQGAKLVTTTAEILEEFNINPTKINAQPEPLVLANEVTNLVKFVGFELTTVNDILTRSNFDVETVTCGLAELEIQGFIKAVPGGYLRCIAS